MVKNTTKIALAAMLVSMAAAAPQVSGAVDLPVGSVVNLIPAAPATYGALVDSQDSLFTGIDSFGNITFTGQLITTVYQGGEKGGLTFVYQLNNFTGDNLEKMALGGWTEATPSVLEAVTPGSQVFQYASRTSEVISFNWFQGIAAGSSATVVIYSAQTSYVKSVVGILDKGTANPISFAPVPEPATFIAGLGALCLFGFTALPKRKS